MEYKDIFQSVGLIIGGIIIAFKPAISEWVSKRKNKNMFTENVKVRNQIDLILDEIRIITGASRVNIMDYHNGKESVSGVPFNYVSMFAESVNVYVSPLLAEIQSQPINPAIPLLLKLIESRHSYIRTTDDDADERIAILQKSYGCKCSYTFLMKDRIDNGTLVISYSNECEELTATQILDVKSLILRINILRDKIRHK